MSGASNNNQRIAKNTLYLYVRLLFSLVVTLYTSRVVLAMLGEVDYGVYGVVGGFVSMFGFLNTSMNNAIQRFYNYEWGKNGKEAVGKVYSHALIIQILLTTFLVIAMESIGIWYINNVMVIPEDRLVAANWVFQFSILAMAFTVLNVPYASAIMAYERIDFYAIIGVIDVCIKLALAIALKYISVDKLVFWALLTPLTSGFTFLCYYIYTKRKLLEVRFKRTFEKSVFKEMLSFAGWNLFGSLSSVMKEHGINLVLNYFFGPVVNAARAVATQISGAVMSFTGNVSTAVRPQLTKSYAEGNIDRAVRYMYTISKVNFLSFLLFAIPLSLETKFVLDIWLGEYPDHTVNFTILVFLTCAVNLLNTPVSMIVHASGKMRNYQVIGSCINMLAIPVAFAAHYFFDVAPEYSLLFIFIFTVFCQIASLFILKSIVSSFSILDYNVRVMFRIMLVLIIASIFPLLIHSWMSEGWLRLLVVCFVSFVSVIIFSYFTALERNEKDMVKTLVRKFIHR